MRCATHATNLTRRVALVSAAVVMCFILYQQRCRVSMWSKGPLRARKRKRKGLCACDVFHSLPQEKRVGTAKSNVCIRDPVYKRRWIHMIEHIVRHMVGHDRTHCNTHGRTRCSQPRPCAQTVVDSRTPCSLEFPSCAARGRKYVRRPQRQS
jgi:hypothetical protein